MASWTDRMNLIIARAEELEIEAKREGNDPRLAHVVADMGMALREASILWGEKREKTE